MNERVDDWRKDMGRCELNDGGECLANIPRACICAQLAGLKRMQRAFKAVFVSDAADSGADA